MGDHCIPHLLSVRAVSRNAVLQRTWNLKRETWNYVEGFKIEPLSVSDAQQKKLHAAPGMMGAQ
jgi:hypothetical protein